MRPSIAKHRDDIREPHIFPLVLERSTEHPKIEILSTFRGDETVHIDLNRVCTRFIRELLQTGLSLKVQVRSHLSAKGMQHGGQLLHAAGFDALLNQRLSCLGFAHRIDSSSDGGQRHQITPSLGLFGERRELRQAKEGATWPCVAYPSDSSTFGFLLGEEIAPPTHAPIALWARTSGKDDLATEICALLKHFDLGFEARLKIVRRLKDRARAPRSNDRLLNGASFA